MPRMLRLHQRVGQAARVEDGLRGTVGPHRIHWVGRVAKQRNPAARPIRQRIAVAGWVFVKFGRCRDQTGHVDMGHGETRDMRHQLLALPRPRPVLPARRRLVAVADLYQHRPIGEAARWTLTFRYRVNHNFCMQAAGHDHRSPGEKERPVARAPPKHQPIPARWTFPRKQYLAHPRMNSISPDQDVAAHRSDMTARPVEKVSRDASFVLGESAQSAPGMNRLTTWRLLPGPG